MLYKAEDVFENCGATVIEIDGRKYIDLDTAYTLGLCICEQHELIQEYEKLVEKLERIIELNWKEKTELKLKKIKNKNYKMLNRFDI